jgi:hypothetical protein
MWTISIRELIISRLQDVVSHSSLSLSLSSHSQSQLHPITTMRKHQQLITFKTNCLFIHSIIIDLTTKGTKVMLTFLTLFDAGGVVIAGWSVAVSTWWEVLVAVV